MADSIDDIKKHSEQEEYTITDGRNNLAELYYQSKQARDDPYVEFSAGVVS